MARNLLTKHQTCLLLAKLAIGALCCWPVFSAHAALTQWSTSASGLFTDPFKWSNGVPDHNDIALFNRGLVAYEVNFPGGPIFEPPPNFSILALIVATNEVSLVKSSSPFLSLAPSLTVLDPNLSIIVGESPGDVSTLNMAIGRLSGANASIGALENTNGTLNVGGTFSLSGSLHVGDEGTGTLNVTGGGRVECFEATLGHWVYSVGQATISGAGSTWTVSDALNIGFYRRGTLVVDSGGNVSNRDCEMGSGALARGIVTVTGVGSTWTNAGHLTVGNEGEGELYITDGGVVSCDVATINADPFETVWTFGSKVRVTGAGSTWAISGALTVGNRGICTLIVEAGGSVSSQNCEIASSGGSSLVTVTGVGSTWTNRGNLTVGNKGTGELSITHGGAVSCNTATIAVEPNSAVTISKVSVTGAGSTWTIREALTVGGSLTIDAGGRVSNTEAFIGSSPFSFFYGVATVAGAGSSWNMDRLSIGSDANRLGRLYIKPGGTVNVAQSVLLYPSSDLFLQGGTLDAQTVNVQGSGGQFQFQSGALHLGTFNGSLVNQGGRLAPGHSAGSTTINGNYTQQAAAVLQIEIGGTSAGGTHDVVSVTGNAILGGQLQLAMLNGFVPSPADKFTVFNAAGVLSGAFANAAAGQRLPTIDGLGSFVVNYGPASAFNQNQIVLSAFQTALSADFDEDGDVDSDDLVQWRGDFGVNGFSDADDDGDSDGVDFLAWQRQFGSGPAVVPTADAVPEPATFVLLIVAAAGWRQRRRRTA